MVPVTPLPHIAFCPDTVVPFKQVLPVAPDPVQHILPLSFGSWPVSHAVVADSPPIHDELTPFPPEHSRDEKLRPPVQFLERISLPNPAIPSTDRSTIVGLIYFFFTTIISHERLL